MIRKFERFVAFRYLWNAEGRSEGRKFLKVVTFIAIGGVTIGVASLLLALAIVRGFSGEITNKIISFGSHIQVKKYLGETIGGAEIISDQLQGIPDITMVNPVVQEFALLRRSSSDIDGVLINGMDSVNLALKERVVDGYFVFTPDSMGRPGLVIGKELSRLLSLSKGDIVTAFSIRQQNNRNEASFSVRPRAKQFYIAGIYETSFARYDEYYVYSDLQSVQQLFNYVPNEVTHFDIQITDANKATDVALAINGEVGFPLEALTVFSGSGNILPGFAFNKPLHRLSSHLSFLSLPLISLGPC